MTASAAHAQPGFLIRRRIPEVSLLPVLAAPGAVIRYTRATESPEPTTLKLENLLPLLSSLSKGGLYFVGSSTRLKNLLQVRGVRL
jgi:hypothetical protein